MPEEGQEQVEGQQVQEQQAPQPSVDPGAGFVVPEGKELVDAGFGEKAARWEQQARGGQKWYETAKQFGIDTPEALSEFGQTYQTLRERGVDPNALRSMFGQHGETKETEQSFGPQDIQKLIDERFTQNSTKAANSQYEEDFKRMGSLVSEYAAQLIPDGATDSAKKFITAAFKQMVIEANQSDSHLYPEDHPLHSKYFKPLSREEMAKVFDDAKPIATAFVGGQGMAVAKSKPVSTPAGKRGAEGTDDDNDMTPQERRRRATRSRIDKVVSGSLAEGNVTSAAAR